IAAIEKLVRILATPAPAFFAREKPISRKAKPACMNMTRMPATITHVVLSSITVWVSEGLSAASATAGSAKSARTASTGARKKLGLIWESPPCVAGTGPTNAWKPGRLETIGARPRGVFVHVEKIRRTAFARGAKHGRNKSGGEPRDLRPAPLYPCPPVVRDYLAAIRSRVVVYDGGMGATLEQFDLTSEDYGGLPGKCHEALVLHRPDVVLSVHESMVAAGAEAVQTDSFQASRLKLDEWG